MDASQVPKMRKTIHAQQEPVALPAAREAVEVLLLDGVAELSKAVINVDQFELDAMAFVAEHGKPQRLTVKEPLALTLDDPEPDAEPEEDEADDEDEPEPPKPKAKPAGPPPKSEHLNTLKIALKKLQPADVKKLANETGIHQADVFKLLNNAAFEKDGNVYWLAK